MDQEKIECFYSVSAFGCNGKFSEKFGEKGIILRRLFIKSL